MNGLLLAGVVLRLVVFCLADPFNPDEHFQVIQYIAEHHRLPVSNELSQSYHPPLYYLLVLPLYSDVDHPKAIHFVSFVLSALNLTLIWWLLKDDQLIPLRSARLIAFGLACFLPQFVMFSSFISNDSLTALVGTMIFATMLRYVRAPTIGRLVPMGVMVGIGLLTKGTFILTGFALAVLVLLAQGKMKPLTIFCAIWLAIGCYKYVDNYVHLNRVIVHNLDRGGDTFTAQRGLWRGWSTVFDINILEIIRRPILKISDPPSYPLLMYATLWYPHIPDSSFEGNITGYQWIGSTLYVLGIVPTAIFICGIISGLRFWKINELRAMILTGSALLLLSNLLVVIAAGIKYDIWWCFQSRLCFQSMLPGLVLFGRGMEFVPQAPWLRRIVIAICWMTIAFCAIYFLVEFGLYYNLLAPGTAVQP